MIRRRDVFLLVCAVVSITFFQSACEQKHSRGRQSQSSICDECRPPGSGHCSWCDGDGKTTWYKEKDGWTYYHREGRLHVFQKKNEEGKIETIGSSEVGPTDLESNWEVAFKKDCPHCRGTGQCPNCKGVGKIR